MTPPEPAQIARAAANTLANGMPDGFVAAVERGQQQEPKTEVQHGAKLSDGTRRE